MRALIKPGPGPGLELVEQAAPDVGPVDVLIAVKRAAICGTDLHIFDWDDWAAGEVVTPVTIGHEFFGVVEAVGDQVTSIEPGERVAGEGHVTCGTCRNCRAGNQHLCRNTVGVGIHRDGGFADLVAIPASNVYRVPEGLSLIHI